MKFVKELKFHNKDTADISSLVEFALDLYNYSDEMKVRYSFIFEETLFDWQELFDPDTEVTFARYEGKYTFRIVLSIPGEKHNTLAENASEDAIEALIPRMKSGLGREITYKYRNGENRVILTLPKKNVEKALFYTNLLYTSYPIITQRRLLSVSMIADTLMLSFFDQHSMTAASLVSSLTLIFTAFMIAFSAGMTAVFSKFWSNRDFTGAGKVFALTMKAGLIIGLLFSAAGFFFSEEILSLYTNVSVIRSLGAEYLKALSLYFLFASASEVLVCYMRNTGAVIRSSLYIIISQIFNCLMNGILIFGLFGAPRMGVRGAALSTVLSSVLLFCLVFSCFMRKKLIKLKLLWFIHCEKDFLKNYYTVTIPLLVRQLLWYVGVNFVSMILGHTNADVLAANAVATTIRSVFSCFYDGTASGCELIMVSTLGMRRFDRAQRNSRYIIRFSAVSGLIKSVVFMLFIPVVPYVFGKMTPETSYYLNIMLIISVVRFFCAFLNANCNNGILLAGGDTKALTLIEVFVMWGLIIIPALLGTFVFEFPVLVIILLAYADEILIFPFDHLRCLKGKWLEMAKETSD